MKLKLFQYSPEDILDYNSLILDYDKNLNVWKLIGLHHCETFILSKENLKCALRFFPYHETLFISYNLYSQFSDMFQNIFEYDPDSDDQYDYLFDNIFSFYDSEEEPVDLNTFNYGCEKEPVYGDL